jgi:16S rRNA (cytidine1402-2'-O)-methyltransferase
LADTLADMAAAFGADRPAALCRELSKTYEEVVRNGLGALAEWSAGGVRGEITLVVQGAPDPEPGTVDAAGLADRVAGLEGQGIPRKEAIALVARSTGTARRAVYDAVVVHRTDRTP